MKELWYYNKNHDLNNGRFIGTESLKMWKYNTGDELYHYGVLGMRWGQHLYSARDRYANRLNKYQQRSQRYADVLARPRNAKQIAKAEKYRAKWLKAEQKAAKVRRKANSGRELSIRQTNKIMRAEKLKAKTRKYEGYNAKYVAKKSKADYMVAKYKKKIDRIDMRTKMWEKGASKSEINKAREYMKKKYGY